MTIEEVSAIVVRHANEWNKEPLNIPLWVSLANSGSPVAIPGLFFGTPECPKAGLEIRAHIILINQAMVPESMLSTFLHELGHAKYRNKESTNWNEIDSEVAAIHHSLSMLEAEGFPDLAVREASAMLEMATDEPYLSAVQRLKGDPIWERFSGGDQNP